MAASLILVYLFIGFCLAFALSWYFRGKTSSVRVYVFFLTVLLLWPGVLLLNALHENKYLGDKIDEFIWRKQ